MGILLMLFRVSLGVTILFATVVLLADLYWMMVITPFFVGKILSYSLLACVGVFIGTLFVVWIN